MTRARGLLLAARPAETRASAAAAASHEAVVVFQATRKDLLPGGGSRQPQIRGLPTVVARQGPGARLRRQTHFPAHPRRQGSPTPRGKLTLHTKRQH